MESKNLSYLYKRGFLPGPNESEEAFFERVHLYDEIRLDPKDLLKHLPFPASEIEEDPLCLKEILPHTFDWLVVIRSDKRLPLWEAAATWTLKQTEKLKLPVLQIRKKTKGAALKEVLCHEGVHILRALFDEPRFEEILAYQTSSSRFRKLFGPLFRRPIESLAFVLLLALSFISELALLFFHPMALLALSPFTLPLIYALYLLVKLAKDRKIYNRFILNLKTLFPKMPTFEMSLFFTDQEIIEGAKKSTTEFRDFIDELRFKDLRMKLFTTEYIE